MGKSILAAVIFAGLLAEGVVAAPWAITSKTTQSSNNRSRGRRRARTIAIGAAGVAAGGALLGARSRRRRQSSAWGRRRRADKEKSSMTPTSFRGANPKRAHEWGGPAVQRGSGGHQCIQRQADRTRVVRF
jgi:hypothetical protein